MADLPTADEKLDRILGRLAVIEENEGKIAAELGDLAKRTDDQAAATLVASAFGAGITQALLQTDKVVAAVDWAKAHPHAMGWVGAGMLFLNSVMPRGPRPRSGGVRLWIWYAQEYLAFLEPDKWGGKFKRPFKVAHYDAPDHGSGYDREPKSEDDSPRSQHSPEKST